MLPYNRSLVKNAKVLRKNMTPQEKDLWYNFLKKLPVPVKRQKNIGNYIVDFYIPNAKLVIELDGSQHRLEDNKAADKARDEYLAALGIKVLRFSNLSVNDSFNYVCRDIRKEIGILD